jgi:hypothetical protein
MPWAPTVTEELRNDVRFALGWKVGKMLRPVTDTERDMVAAAIVEHIRLCYWRVERGSRGAGLRSWGGVTTSEPRQPMRRLLSFGHLRLPITRLMSLSCSGIGVPSHARDETFNRPLVARSIALAMLLRSSAVCRYDQMSIPGLIPSLVI